MAHTAGSMTYNSPAVSPHGLTEARTLSVEKKEGRLRVVAHNGASLVGGAERALLMLLCGLRDRGHSVSLACNHEIVADEATRRRLPAIVLPLRGDAVVGDAWRFAQYLRREAPNALLLGTFKKIWLGGMAAARAGVPRTVARVGLASDTPRRWKYRFALRHWIDAVVLNAESMRPSFEAGATGFDLWRIVTIHNGVVTPPRRQPPRAVRGELGIPAEAQVIGAIARLSRQKRLERLIDATAKLPAVHCIIAGAGSQQDQLTARIRELGLQDRAHLLQHRDDVGDVLDALDLFVVCSDQEGMSNSMLEAMSTGLPVVSTPVSGAHEALAPLRDGRTPGCVLQSFEPDELARIVGGLLEKPALLRMMGEAAAQAATERFDFDRMVSSYEAVLRGGALGLCGDQK
jgi:glycosyltransferase involved in cell wall biosynthesis